MDDFFSFFLLLPPPNYKYCGPMDQSESEGSTSAGHMDQYEIIKPIGKGAWSIFAAAWNKPLQDMGPELKLVHVEGSLRESASQPWLGVQSVRSDARPLANDAPLRLRVF